MEKYQEKLLQEYKETSSFVAFLRNSKPEISAGFAFALGEYQGIVAGRIKDEGLDVPSSANTSITPDEFKVNFEERLKNLKNGFVSGTIVTKVPDENKRKLLLKQYVAMENIFNFL